MTPTCTINDDGDFTITCSGQQLSMLMGGLNLLFRQTPDRITRIDASIFHDMLVDAEIDATLDASVREIDAELAAEQAEPELIDPQAGHTVDYHGSLTDMHGVWTVKHVHANGTVLLAHDNDPKVLNYVRRESYTIKD